MWGWGGQGEMVHECVGGGGREGKMVHVCVGGWGGREGKIDGARVCGRGGGRGGWGMYVCDDVMRVPHDTWEGEKREV